MRPMPASTREINVDYLARVEGGQQGEPQRVGATRKERRESQAADRVSHGRDSTVSTPGDAPLAKFRAVSSGQTRRVVRNISGSAKTSFSGVFTQYELLGAITSPITLESAGKRVARGAGRY